MEDVYTEETNSQSYFCEMVHRHLSTTKEQNIKEEIKNMEYEVNVGIRDPAGFIANFHNLCLRPLLQKKSAHLEFGL
jgi:hypothetical protein